MFKKLKNIILDLFFPFYCVGCGKIGHFVCPRCEGEIIKIKDQTCPFCNRISVSGKLCPRCRAKSSLTGVIVWARYKDPIVKKIVRAYKYQGMFASHEFISRHLIELLKKESARFDVVAYAPMSRKRKAERGYNQAELLAKDIATTFGRPIFHGLRKTKNTKPQVGLKRKDRQKNLAQVFATKKADLIIGKRVLLIDDVITTGTTLNECAKVLRRAGARQVWGMVIAKE